MSLDTRQGSDTTIASKAAENSSHVKSAFETHEANLHWYSILRARHFAQHLSLVDGCILNIEQMPPWLDSAMAPIRKGVLLT